MADEVIAVSAEWAKRAYVDDAKYKAMYEASTQDPARFWDEHAKRVDARTASSALSDADVDAILATHQKTYRAHEKQLKGVMAESVEDSIDTKRSWNTYR